MYSFPVISSLYTELMLVFKSTVLPDVLVPFALTE